MVYIQVYVEPYITSKWECTRSGGNFKSLFELRLCAHTTYTALESY